MLILASSSPRRQELLRNARILFKTHPADVPEELREGEGAVDFVHRLAFDKARAVYERLQPQSGTLVLGADTSVVVDGAVLGKPADEQDAARMLRLLSGREHEVVTGVCLIGQACVAETGQPDGDNLIQDVRHESTRVFFDSVSDQDIEDYVSTGEPMDKAGAYAIQGAASRWIPKIDGCYFNVVGLPVPLVCRMLRQHGRL